MFLDSIANNSTLWNILPWVPTMVFALIMVWELFAGLRRGKSKSIKLFITFALSIVVAVVFFIVVKKNFDTWSVSLCKAFNLSLKDMLKTSSDYSTLTGYLEDCLSNNEQVLNAIEAQGMTVTEASKFIYSVALIVVNIALFLVCIVVFWVAKFIFYIFYLIFAREGRRKKKINKKYESEKNNPNNKAKPYKKKKLMGGLVGLVRGFIVALVCVAPFGLVSTVVSKGEVTVPDAKDDDTDETKMAYEIVRVVTKFDTTGIGKVLNVAKNKEGLPLYLIVADKLTSTSYTYTNEDGEEETLTLSLTKDIAPLTRATCKTALIFLQYGFDTSKSNDQDYIAEFVSSDKQIDGKTLEEAVSETLDGMTIEEKSMLGYTCNKLAIAYAQKTVGSDVNEDNLSEQELSTKLLYHAFLGKNAISTTDLVSGNLGTAFELFVDYMKYKDDIDAFSNAFKTESSTSLVYGISRTASSEKSTRGAEFAEVFYEDLCDLSFFNETKFNNLLTDCVCDILSTSMPDFDFTLSTNQNLYDINWAESIEGIFTSFGNLIDNVVNNNIETKDDLMHYYINELSDSTSKVYTRINNIIDSSALSILFNTNGFNNLLDDTINKAMSSVAGSDITLLKTNWGTYKNESGETVDGEFKKILTSAIPTFAKVYDVVYGKDEVSDDDLANVIEIISDPNTELYNVIDTTNKAHSNVIHALISDLMTSIEFELDGTTSKLYFEDSLKETLDVESKKVISTTSLKELLKFLNGNSHIIADLKSGDIDYITLISDNVTNIKTSEILKSVSSQLVYKFAKSALTIPSVLSLEDDVIEQNINLWVNSEDGEIVKVLNIVENELDLIKEATKEDVDSEELIAKFAKSSDASIKELVSSKIINATFTDKITSLTSTDSEFVIEIPDYAYTDSSKINIKSDEYVSLIKFFKYAFDVNDDTTAIKFDNLKYKKIIDSESISYIRNSSIATTSASYWFYNELSNMNAVASYLEIPTSYSLDISNNTMKTDYESSPWKDELPNLLQNVKLLGIEFSDSNEISIDLKNVFYLGDYVDDANTTTKVDNLYTSTILKASLSKTLSTIDAIYIPRDAKDESNYVTASDMALTFRSFKTLIGEHLNDEDFSIDNTQSYIDLSKYSTKMDELKTIVKPHIVTASIANMVVKQEGTSFSLPSGYSFNSTNETNLKNNWYYVNETNEGELIYMLESINTLGLLSSVTSSDGLNNIDANVILNAVNSMDTLLQSRILWFTMSNKMFETTSITITNADVSEVNDELYVAKDEFNNLVNALNVLAKDGNISELNTDLSNVLANSDTIKKSSIIRTLVTDSISQAGNTIIMERKKDNNTETFANKLQVYNTNKELTDTYKCQVTSKELGYFLEAAKGLLGENTTSYEIDYNNLQLASISTDYLQSTIILAGLQSQLSTAKTTTSYTPQYVYTYVSTEKSYDEFISYEDAVVIIQNIKNNTHS